MVPTTLAFVAILVLVIFFRPPTRAPEGDVAH